MFWNQYSSSVEISTIVVLTDIRICTVIALTDIKISTVVVLTDIKTSGSVDWHLGGKGTKETKKVWIIKRRLTWLGLWRKQLEEQARGSIAYDMVISSSVFYHSFYLYNTMWLPHGKSHTPDHTIATTPQGHIHVFLYKLLTAQNCSTKT